MAGNRIRARSTVALVISLFSTAVAFAVAVAAAPGRPLLKIPQGSSPSIDGVMNRKEWDDAAQVSIRIDSAWMVRVFLKHDAENLYLAFAGVERAGKRVFPEVLLDPQLRGGEKWSRGQLWLHVSNNLCEGNGEYNVYERSGVLHCAHAKTGWEGNNPPNASDVIEIRISFTKMGLTAPLGKTIGLALDVTDATGRPDQLFRYWPATAQIARPASWGTAVTE
jgi:hypothetical protein